MTERGTRKANQSLLGASALAALVAIVLSGCAPDARRPALESAAAAFAALQERVTRDLPALPATDFVGFIEAGGLRIGPSAIGDDTIEFAGASETYVTAASENDGVGTVQAVVTGVGNAGSGDLYDDAIVYACFELSVDIEQRAVVEYANVECPPIVADPMAGYDLVHLRDIS